MRHFVHSKVLIALGLIGLVAAFAADVSQIAAQGKGAKSNKNIRARRPKWNDKTYSKVVDDFFPDAREMLVGKPVGGGGTVASTGGGPTSAGGDTTAAAKSYPWSQIIKREAVEDEIKSSLTPLKEYTKTPGVFQGKNDPARTTMTTMAVMFAVIQQYDADIRWKKEAAELKDLLARTAKNAKVGTSQVFKEAKDLTTNLDELIRGGSPALEAAPSNADGGWPVVADFSPVMKRMKIAGEDNLKQWTANKQEFDSHLDEVAHEAQVLAVLGTIIKDDKYGSGGGDKQFDGFADDLRKACQDVKSAVEQKNYDQARTAVGAINNACSSCHGAYR